MDRFLASHDVPIVEGRHCTFLFEVRPTRCILRNGFSGCPIGCPCANTATTLWYIVLKVPEELRVNYQLEVRRGHHDPLQRPSEPQAVAQSLRSYLRLLFELHTTPEWTVPDGNVASGELTEFVVHSRAMQRDCSVTVYLPARFSRTESYPLLVVHDGGDFLQYSAAKVVLDNLIDSREIAETIVAFSHPKDRLVEYANSDEHARFLTHELLPQMEAEFPLVRNRFGRGLLGPALEPLQHCLRRTDTRIGMGLWYSCLARSSLPTREPTTAVALSLIRW